MRTWLILALVAVSGCYDAHGAGAPGDAGPLPGHDAGLADAAGACEERPTTPSGLVCPATAGLGEEIVVSVTHAPGGCCSAEGAGAVAVPRGEASFLISTRWDACTCCDACECAGAPVTHELSLGARDRAGVITVRAGSQECEIEIVARSCEPVAVDEAHAPIGVAIGEPIPVLVRRHEPWWRSSRRRTGPPRSRRARARSWCRASILRAATADRPWSG